MFSIGLTLLRYLFIDIDECSMSNGGCQVDCDNTVGGFECDCPDWQMLGIDDSTCLVSATKF